MRAQTLLDAASEAGRRRGQFLSALAVAALLALGAGCGDPVKILPDAAPASDCGTYAATLELLTPDGSYAALDTSPRAELVLGFQGFQMVFVRVRASRPPPLMWGALVAQLDGRPPWSQSFPELALRDDGHGGFIADPFPLFFNSATIAELGNRGCALTLRLGPKGCGAMATGHVTLVYQPGCTQSADGGIACPDGGTG